MKLNTTFINLKYLILSIFKFLKEILVYTYIICFNNIKR